MFHEHFYQNKKKRVKINPVFTSPSSRSSCISCSYRHSSIVTIIPGTNISNGSLWQSVYLKQLASFFTWVSSSRGPSFPSFGTSELPNSSQRLLCYKFSEVWCQRCSYSWVASICCCTVGWMLLQKCFDSQIECFTRTGGMQPLFPIITERGMWWYMTGSTLTSIRIATNMCLRSLKCCRCWLFLRCRLSCMSTSLPLLFDSSILSC